MLAVPAVEIVMQIGATKTSHKKATPLKSRGSYDHLIKHVGLIVRYYMIKQAEILSTLQ
jgi:hypothetical protein